MIILGIDAGLACVGNSVTAVGLQPAPALAA